MPLIGDSASISFAVTEGATAIALGSGDVAVLGTPKVVALCEEAAVGALAGTLPDGATSVGTHITVDHNAPTPTGRVVTATATVTKVDGRAIEFSVSVTEGETVVATGRHIRMVVDRNRFVARLA
jgi:predicted thioesterase